jgi:hypothetical protein
LLLLATVCGAQIIPANRTYPWVPGQTVGVPGGIPSYPVATNVSGIDNTGGSDVRTILENILAACPYGHAVYLGPGTYYVGWSVDIPNGVVLRGAGKSTVIESHTGTGSALVLGLAADYPDPASGTAITAGATAGSSNVTVASTSGLVVNKMVNIQQQSVPDYVWVGNGDSLAFTETHLLTAINGNQLTIWPPLPLTLTNSPTLVYFSRTTTSAGVENLKLNCTNVNAHGIEGWQCWGCWVTNVEIAGCIVGAFYGYNWNMGSILGCYTHDSTASGASNEQIDMVKWCSWNLLENNMAYHAGFPNVVLGDGNGGCVGNVVAYNYIPLTDSGSGVAGSSIDLNHGAWNMFNLIEGNVCQMIQSDGYYGGAGYNTFYRNYASGVFAPVFSFARCVDITHFSYWFTVAENVLGTNDRAFQYSTQVNGYAGNPLIYRWGYPNIGNSSYTGTNYAGITNTIGLDLTAEPTGLLLNNYDYANTGIVNPTNGLPASLYRSSKPEWFGNWPWPAIGPELTPMRGRIPSEARFLGLVPPTTPATNPPVNNAGYAGGLIGLVVGKP